MLVRRRFLSFAALGAGAFWVGPHLALANVASERRFVFVIQRGAADGLDIVRPYGDPAYAALRGRLAGGADAIKLDGLFALHPALVELGRMYAQRQALFVHAVASPYRDRSHFDGQNVLETGGLHPYEVKDGWLNRLVALLPQTRDEAIAIAATVPMALRGRAPVTSYAPSGLPQASDDLMTRVATLYDADPQLHPLWAAAMDATTLAGHGATKQDPASLGRLSASFLAQDNGPRIAMIETGGWDTHTAQAPRLAAQLKALDTMLAALRDGLGPVWLQTTVLVATEFGRTAAVNGTGGTDHGTGTVAMLAGGAVRGGRVVTDWPGLAANQLYEDRDLRPTASLDALIAGVAGESLGLDPEHVARALFPAAPPVRPITGLVRA
ncbi:DUF1501 domain-containing protein [Lichenicoccus sp.]|uniref:DUF1501 domain-containing protein n=1 Tax=Lichenicoccus sp. TaxID=2781899 RepID=UPI003D103F31